MALQGGQTSLAPDSDSSAERLGEFAFGQFKELQARMQRELERRFNVPRLYDAGALFTRIEGQERLDHWNLEPGHKYWNLHVDKANRHSYDYSALLYLNSHCIDKQGCDLTQDFTGGLLQFKDTDADLLVVPRVGRLLLFIGGLENLHTVQKVHNGTRFVLAMWFSCNEASKYTAEKYDTPSDRAVTKELPAGEDCGYAGITERECQERGCLYDDSVPNVPWCVHVHTHAR